jgi:RNA polymerase sigma-70 factor (ECF subfamily)
VHDEESLVKQAVQGDQVAFSRLYEEYFDKIYRYIAVRIGDRIEAEDMTQQVFLKAVKSISSYKWRGVPFSAWLFRIAHNQLVDHLRKKKKQPATLFDETFIAGDSNPQLMAERNLDIEQLKKATEKLTKAQSEVISLRFAGGMSVAQVSKIMGRSEGAVKALQHSAIVSLRKILSVGNDEEVQNI